MIANDDGVEIFNIATSIRVQKTALTYCTYRSPLKINIRPYLSVWQKLIVLFTE